MRLTRWSPRRGLARPGAVLLAVVLAAAGLTGCGTGAPAAGADRPAALPRDEALRELLPESVRAAGVLVVGTDASYAPANAFADDGRTVVGFEPDLAAAVGEVLGVRIEMRVRPFDGLLADVRAHRVDLGMAAVTDTAERERLVDFVSYFSAGTAVVVRRGNPHGILELGDLCGRTVAVERATVQVDLLARAQRRCQGAPIRVSLHRDNAEALLQLRTGRASAVLNDYPPAVALSEDRRTRAFYQLAADTQYEPGLYGVAVAKDRALLRDAVHGALERVMASGRYTEVLARWNVSGGAVAAPVVNSATGA